MAYLHKLPPYNPGSFLSKVLFHSLLADPSEMLKQGLPGQQEHGKKAVLTARSTKHRKVMQQTTVLVSAKLSVPLSPSPAPYKNFSSVRKLLATKSDLSYQQNLLYLKLHIQSTSARNLL